MALLPLLPLTLSPSWPFWKERIGPVPIWVLSLLGCVAIAVALFVGSSITQRTVINHRRLWEPLPLIWLLPVNFRRLHPVMRFFDLAGIVGAGSLFSLALYQLRKAFPFRSLCPETLLFAGSASALLVLHLMFNQINDTYIVGFLPFILLLVASSLQSIHMRDKMLRVSVASSLILVLAVSYWMRGEYAAQETIWSSAEGLYRTGVPPSSIFATYHWEVYHGAYDGWIADGHPESFYIWLHSKDLQKPYSIQLALSPEAPPGWKLLASRSYRNLTFQKRYVVTLEEDSAR